MNKPNHETLTESLARVTGTLSAGEPRQSQISMAHLVADALETGTPLIVEAPTGVGKSLGYLVPVALSRRKTIISTATKALQDQLIQKEVPSLHAAGIPISASVLKGRVNYLCQQKLSRQRMNPPIGLDPVASSGYATIIEWSERTSTGDRDELTDGASSAVWSSFAMSSEECPGADRCPMGQICYAERAQRLAKESDIVIVNSALYGAHLAHGSTFLPAHEIVVFDEAHELPDILTRALGVEISPPRIRSLSPLIRALDNVSFFSPLEELMSLASDLEKDLADYDSRADAALTPSLVQDLIALELALEGLATRLESLSADHDITIIGASAQSFINRLRDDIARFLAPNDGDLLYVHGFPRRVLVCSPVSLGPALAQTWSELTPIFTSATIPTYLPEAIGLAEHSYDKLDSPFDYASNSLLFVPPNISDRRDPDTEIQIANHLAHLIEISRGRCLALFTSHRALQEIGRRVQGLAGTPILLQGDRPRATLLREFTENEEVSLFATMGFWQGVDIPGRSLSLLAIDRLPFSRPDDPLLNARRELAGPSAFYTIDLPRAAMMLAQGVGRLIRSSSDKGVVVVYDSRLATAKYKNVLLNRLPPMRRTVDENLVEHFLQQITKE